MDIIINTEKAGFDSLAKLQEFTWPFSVIFSREAKSHLRLVGDRLELACFEENMFATIPWTGLIKKWKKDKTINGNVLKALKAKKGDLIVDATVGFAGDATFFLAQGMRVEGFERSQIIYTLQQGTLLLEDENCDELANITLHYGQASARQDRFPCIYFDPMFDDGSRRKAAAKKEMTMLHALVGGDHDACEEALKLRERCDRLVIKRAPKAPQILENRNSSWETKAVRFDLYL